jgi:hypothetical protein
MTGFFGLERTGGHFSGTYNPEDVRILLKPTQVEAIGILEKEALIQSGKRHYSEMLSPEMVPDGRYIELYEAALARNGAQLRGDVDLLARGIADRPETRTECVILSLARAGTPIGVLLKHALERIGIVAHHYSISIIRGRGIDREALRYVNAKHGVRTAVFLDGWTGKGAIKGELERSLQNCPFGYKPYLAVVADPAGRADLAATTDDYVIPSGLLNGIVSGLISRSVLNDELVKPGDFHACVFQDHHAAHDLTRNFIDAIDQAQGTARTSSFWSRDAAAHARITCRRLMVQLSAEYGIDDVNRIKPGIAEATRAILRRLPDMVILRDLEDPEVAHMRHIAATADVPVIQRDLNTYRAVTIIKNLGNSQE